MSLIFSPLLCFFFIYTMSIDECFAGRMTLFFFVFYHLIFLNSHVIGETCSLLGLDDGTKFPDSIFDTFGLNGSPISYFRLNQPGFSLPHQKIIRISFGNLIKYF